MKVSTKAGIMWVAKTQESGDDGEFHSGRYRLLPVLHVPIKVVGLAVECRLLLLTETSQPLGLVEALLGLKLGGVTRPWHINQR